jgi:hypothetical protein
MRGLQANVMNEGIVKKSCVECSKMVDQMVTMMSKVVGHL